MRSFVFRAQKGISTRYFLIHFFLRWHHCNYCTLFLGVIAGRDSVSPARKKQTGDVWNVCHLQLGTMIITCLNKANAFCCVRDGASFKSMLWHVLGNDQFFFCICSLSAVHCLLARNECRCQPFAATINFQWCFFFHPLSSRNKNETQYCALHVLAYKALPQTLYRVTSEHSVHISIYLVHNMH
jgi:hypothetical protein